MRIEYRSDGVLERFNNALAHLSDGEVKTVGARALNHVGNKARTQVKRALVKTTGINYNLINRGMATHKAHKGKLEYEIRQKGSETNIGLFNARQTKKGVSAAPWKNRQVFKSTFIISKAGGAVYKRTGKGRFPIKQVYGPNLAREIVKGEPLKAWEQAQVGLAERIGHEIYYILSKR